MYKLLYTTEILCRKINRIYRYKTQNTVRIRRNPILKIDAFCSEERRHCET